MRTEPLPGGGVRSVASTDDYFHGFEVALDVRDGEVASADARTWKHPWTTCPGALASVRALSGPVAAIKDAILSTPRSETCVHVNDLVGLASRCHQSRVYEIRCDPTSICMSRDGHLMWDLALEQWTIASAPFDGYTLHDPRWRTTLDERGASEDEKEAVLMIRRGILVAMGIYLLDWSRVSRGHHIEYGVMPGSCHTFSEPQVHEATSLVDPPR